MDFQKKNKNNHEPKQQQHPLHQALNTIQKHVSSIFHLPANPPSNSNPFCSLSSTLGYPWRRRKENFALSDAEIKERMTGIPVYECSNYSQDPYVFFSDHDKDKRILLYYLSKRDAEVVLHEQLKFAGPGKETRKVLDIPLSNILEFEGCGLPIRLVPDSSQVKNAVHEITKKKSSGIMSSDGGGFPGVPVFRSDCLIITDPETSKKYRPAYLKKEDLEDTIDALVKPDNKKRDDIIQVAALEDIIQEMKDSSISKSNDVLFVGPGITSWTWDGTHRSIDFVNCTEK